ncbi:MAG TPA: MT-A70 family methyltransferase [Xanthobacteraceae bacterium]|nr:MT-A70 family methyltransferase [Xanthobacteraceae bacterium]
MTTLAFHPLAEIFPLIAGDDFDALVEDVREHGIRDPIILLEKQVIDGRNRFRALQQLIETGEVLGDGWGHRRGQALTPSALEPPQLWFHAYNRSLDGDPLAWVLSKNLKRRHLNESQRAMVAAKIANLGVGRPKVGNDPVAPHIPPIGGISARATAAMLNVGARSVERARAVLSEGVAELQQAVERGAIAVSAAAVIAHATPGEQAAILESAGDSEKRILAAAKEINARRRHARFAEVTQRLASISEGSKPLPTGQQFPIIYADPATRFVSGFGDRSIENHYPTMTLAELCALPVSEIALPDAVLFIWTTVPQLRNTMTMIEAWGFHYVSAWCWDKVDPGSGYWGFSQHEELLIAKRGKFPAPVPGTQPRSLYREKKTEHSAKPDWFAEQIERIWPALPKIELFARRPRPGWAAWGNQADSQAKASVGNGATVQAVREPADCMSGEVSRPAAGRSAAATSEQMDVTAGETAPHSPIDVPDFLPRRGSPCAATEQVS